MLLPILYSWLCCEIALSHDTEILVSNDHPRSSFLTRLDHTAYCWLVDLPSITSFPGLRCPHAGMLFCSAWLLFYPPSDHLSALASDHTSLSSPSRLFLTLSFCSHRCSNRINTLPFLYSRVTFLLSSTWYTRSCSCHLLQSLPPTSIHCPSIPLEHISINFFPSCHSLFSSRDGENTNLFIYSITPFPSPSTLLLCFTEYTLPWPLCPWAACIILCFD